MEAGANLSNALMNSLDFRKSEGLSAVGKMLAKNTSLFDGIADKLSKLVECMIPQDAFSFD